MTPDIADLQPVSAPERDAVPRAPVTLELLAQALTDIGIASERADIDRLRTFWIATQDGPALLADLDDADRARPITWRVHHDAVLVIAVLPVADAVRVLDAGVVARRWNRTKPWPFLEVDLGSQCVIARGTIPCYSGAAPAELSRAALGLARCTASVLAAIAW